MGLKPQAADLVSCLFQQQQAELASSPDSQGSLACSPRCSQDSLQGALQRKADEKRAMLRRPEYDPPCRVADGLFIGEGLPLRCAYGQQAAAALMLHGLAEDEPWRRA